MNKVSLKEKLGYGVGAVGLDLSYGMFYSYLSIYLTNALGISPLFLLILAPLARLWDGINDPMMGMIVDRRTMKHGRMKPYILMATPLIAVLTLLMYLSPDLDKAPLMIFSAVVYILWGMAYTMADVPFWTLPNVLTPNSKERSDVISFTKIINSIGSALPEVLFLIIPFVLTAVYNSKGLEIGLGFEKTKYLLIAIFAVVIGGIMYVNCYFHIKERVVLPNKKKIPGQPSSLSRLFKCKPLMLVVMMGVLSSGRYLVQAAAIHVARYSFYIGPEIATQADIVKSISLVKTIFQVCTIVGMFGTTLIMPFLMKKFDYKKIVITTCLLGFAASVVTTAIGYITELSSIYILAPFIVIQSIPLGVINVISYAMICDSLDYMELTTGVRENGLGSACQGFINKIGNAFATCGIIVLYMAIDMNPEDMLSNDALKSALEVLPEQRFAMFSLVSLIPGISMLLCSIPMFFYKIAGKEKEKMLADLKAKREAEGFVVEE